MFRLERVLRWKKTLEKEARVQRLEIERRVDALDAEAMAARQRRASAPDGAASLDESRLWGSYLEREAHEEMKLRLRVQELRPSLEEKVTRHLAARRDERALERLKERRLARWRRSRETRLQAMLDDVAARQKPPELGTFVRPPRDIGPSPGAQGLPTELQINELGKTKGAAS